MSEKLALIILTFIILGAFLLRNFGINWDQGHHMHPDERAIVMTVTDLSYPSSLDMLLSSSSSWNPKFFAYGSFPFYLLRIAGDLTSMVTNDSLFASYDKINIVGRFISSLFDIGVLVMIFLIGKHIYNKKIGLVAAGIYSISVLPIQLSHFYAVDTPVTFFLISLLYMLLLFYEKPNIKKSIIIGFLFGFALATKISASVILVAIGFTIGIDFLLLFIKNPHRSQLWFPHLPRFVIKLIKNSLIIFSVTFLTYFILSPYSFINSSEFIRQTIEQSHMTKDAFTFPYTLQYVGKIPYFYELTQIFLFGFGPVLGLTAFVGTGYVFYHMVTKKGIQGRKELIIFSFFIPYFIVVGNFAVGFMRYMLPLYPLFGLFAAVFLVSLADRLKNKNKSLLLLGTLISILLLLVWPVSFIQIYHRPNSRVLATEFINTNIPVGSVIAIEHWDDALPIWGQEKYKMLTLPMYEPDTSEKWTTVRKILDEADYIILASNRLYTPLMRLNDCLNLPPGRCYVATAMYYKELLAGNLGFLKIAEITSYPTIPLLKLQIPDQQADESFTVYDHPKVIIFEKWKENKKN